MIPDSIIQEVRDRADIVELVSEFLPLRRAGKDFKALCPFHNEKTPSFYVVPAKGFYKCFGCGESGDVFRFLMQQGGLGFLDAVKLVAGRVGVEIPESEAGRQQEEAHRHLYEAVAFAADFYRGQLQSPAGERARRYLEERGIGAEAVERFQLGYAPAEWRALRAAAHRHGIGDEVLLEAGLVKETEKSDEPYDRMRDRVIFPIPEVGGRIVAFGGRVIGKGSEGAPKYLNSPETPIYHKGRLLYGIHWARGAIRREEAVLVVEGNMDYVSLAGRGIENVVAGLGTSMTTEQARLLARYAQKALLLYDSDAAGLRATFKTADALLREGVHPLVVTLPPGEDPDSLVRAGGARALVPYLEDAIDVLERKIMILEERGYFEDIEGIRKALDGLLPTLRAVQDPTLRDLYVGRVAQRTGVRPETLQAETAAEAQAPPAPEPPRAEARAPRGASRAGERRQGERRAALPPGLAGERKLLLLLVRDPARLAAAAERLRPEDFGDPGLRELFAALVEHGGVPEGDPSVLRLSALGLQRLDELRADPEELSEGDRIFEESVRDILVEGRYRRLDELSRLIKLAEMRGDFESYRTLVTEKTELARETRAVAQGLESFIRKRGRPERSGPSTYDG